MTFMEALFATLLVVIYFALLFTVCLLTFRKGHTLLGIIGIFVPFLWLLGAILPARPGSRYAIEMSQQYGGGR